MPRTSTPPSPAGGSPRPPDRPSPASLDNSSDKTRLTWPEVAVIAMTLAFMVFLMSTGMPVHIAAFNAVGTVAAVIAVVILPRRVVEGIKLLRKISHAVDDSGRAS